MKLSKILLQRKNNLLSLYPVPGRLRQILERRLTYRQTIYLRGQSAKIAKAMGRRLMQVDNIACYLYDDADRLIFPYGQKGRIMKTLRDFGYQVVYRDEIPHPHPEVFKPHWDLIERRFKLRYQQRALLEIIVRYDRGRLDLPTGFGKSFSIGLLALLWPKAVIDIIVAGREPLLQMYNDLSRLVTSVGLIGAGKQDFGCMVTCISADSLHLAAGCADVVIGDECHQLATDKRLNGLYQYDRPIRAYGLSASQDARMDGRDFELHNFFGPIRLLVPYDEAVKHRVVVPLQVWWVTSPANPSLRNRLKRLTDTAKERAAVWKNDLRNQQIADAASQLPADCQVLITCRTLEHAVHLKAKLPGATLVYDEKSMHEHRRKNWIRQGLLSKSEPLMTVQRRAQLKQEFETGALKLVIATTVWNVGVNFHHLAFLIRADAGASSVANTQIPGRLSRLASGKRVGVLIDCWDRFDRTYLFKARARRKDYANKKWKQFSWNKGYRLWAKATSSSGNKLSKS